MPRANRNAPNTLGCKVILLVLAGVCLAETSAIAVQVAPELVKQATWRWPDPASFEQHLVSFLDQRQAPVQLRDEVLKSWLAGKNVDHGPLLLDRILITAAIVEPRIAELVKQLNDMSAPAINLAKIEWLPSEVPGWLQDSIRLACGRSLAQRRLYDESLEFLNGIELVQACDPASLIFYRAVCEHHLLKKNECLVNLRLLLERETELPMRYAQVANLMLADIEPLKSESLDEISRLMTDVHRRLDLGRAGKRVRDEEQDIVDKLDKMIKKIEQQIQQARQQSQQQNGSKQQNAQGADQPMENSQIAGGTGPGDVDKKDMNNKSAWGNLPPAQRQEALQRMTEELPSHYRDVIENYFRRLAKGDK